MICETADSSSSALRSTETPTQTHRDNLFCTVKANQRNKAGSISDGGCDCHRLSTPDSPQPLWFKPAPDNRSSAAFGPEHMRLCCGSLIWLSRAAARGPVAAAQQAAADRERAADKRLCCRQPASPETCGHWFVIRDQTQRGTPSLSECLTLNVSPAQDPCELSKLLSLPLLCPNVACS